MSGVLDQITSCRLGYLNMKNKKLPETFKGYSTKDLLKTWDEIRTFQGTSAPMEMIEAMREFLKASKLGLFEALDELRQKGNL
jgi:hypothetical protein